MTIRKAARIRGTVGVANRGNVLALVQPRTRRSDLRLQATDLSSLAREVVARSAPDGASRTSFDAELADGLPWVAVDRARIETLLGSLLRDAARAIGDEWGTVSVSTGLARNDARFVSPTYPRDCLLGGLDPGLYAWIEVHDTGWPRALDLAQARALLRAHGGALRVDADPGLGTRVILLLPA